MTAIGMIYAHDLNHGIGCRGRLAWKHPLYIELFWETIGQKPVVVGYNTWETSKKYFLKRRPHATHLVLSSKKRPTSEKNVHVMNLERLSDVISNGGFGDVDIPQVWVTGGAQVYGHFEECADVVVETTIAVATPYDAWFDHRKNGFFSEQAIFSFKQVENAPEAHTTYWIDRSRSKLTVNRILCNLGLEWFTTEAQMNDFWKENGDLSWAL